MKRLFKVLSLVCLLLFAGCTTLYKPNTVYSPLIQKQGQFNASGALALSGGGLYNLQAAYGITRDIAAMVDGMYHTRYITYGDSSSERLNIYSAEGGAGYFSPFGDEKKGLLQVYAGSGYGISSDKINNNSNTAAMPEMRATYYNFFIQPGIAYVDKNFNISFDLRTNFVNIYNIHAYLYDEFKWWNTDFHYHNDTSLHFGNVEPVITVKGGGALKAVFQVGVTLPYFNPKAFFIANSYSRLGVPLIKLSLGLSYTFRKKD